MKRSLDIFHFLEEISSLSTFVVVVFFSSSFMHCSLKKAFLSLLFILWKSSFIWMYLSLSPLLFTSLHSSAVFQISSVTQSCLTVWTPWTAACQASLSIINSWSLLKLRSVELMMPSSHLILCRPLLLLPSVFPSIRVFTN